MEVWRDIKGYEGIYMISDQGRVKSIGYGKEKILKPNKNTRGYYKIDLCKNNIRKTYLIHRLICIHFLDNPSNKTDVNHINGIKDDNRLSNLEWNTRSENIQHAYNNGLKEQHKGINHHNSRFTEKDIIDIRESKLTQREIGEIYGIDRKYVNKIRTRKIWKHI